MLANPDSQLARIRTTEETTSECVYENISKAGFEYGLYHPMGGAQTK